MTCDRYWREGIVLVERGQDDPHREGCADCRRAHTSRQELIDALPLVGGGSTGDPRWQAHVWQRIDAEQRGARRRWVWPLLGVVATACMLVLWIGRNPFGAAMARPQVEIVPVGDAMRSLPTSVGSLQASVGDHVRVSVGEASEVWIYRGEQLALRCAVHAAAPGCTPDRHGMVAEMTLDLPGMYHVLIVDVPVLPPTGAYDADRAALVDGRVVPIERTVRVP